MEVQERRRRTTLSEQLSAAAPSKLSTTSSSPNLRDLLKVRQEEDPNHEQRVCGRRSASVSLGTFLACEKRELSAAGLVAVTAAVGGRTLLDVMRDEGELGGGGGGGGGGAVYRGVVIGSSNGGQRISWKAFRERLRVRRSGAAWQSAATAGGGNAEEDVSAAGLIVASGAVVPSSPTPMPEGNLVRAGAVPEQNRSSSVVSSAREAAAAAPQPPMPTTTANSATGAAASGQAEGSAATRATQRQPQQIRVSLMALLEQTDRLGGGDGPGFAVSALLGPAGEEEEEEEVGGGGGGEREKMYVKCCVCMVRHKGAAFIPCGHTFCRLCSRELWVARGSCPLCNGFILEILDIF